MCAILKSFFFLGWFFANMKRSVGTTAEITGNNYWTVPRILFFRVTLSYATTRGPYYWVTGTFITTPRSRPKTGLISVREKPVLTS